FLDRVLKDQPIEYQIRNKTIFIKERPAARQSVNTLLPVKAESMAYIDISGTVRNSAGVPLEGATVTIKGTSIVTTTNAEGGFTIKAEKGQTLVISFVGHETKQQLIGEDVTLNIVLKEVESQLEQV